MALPDKRQTCHSFVLPSLFRDLILLRLFQAYFFLFALASAPILWASYFFIVCDAMRYASVCVAVYLVLMMGAVHLDRHNGFDLAITNLFSASMLGMILCFFIYVDVLKKDTVPKTCDRCRKSTVLRGKFQQYGWI